MAGSRESFSTATTVRWTPPPRASPPLPSADGNRDLVFECFVKDHFQRRGHYILKACEAYMEGCMIASLTEEGCETEESSEHPSSVGFKLMLAKILPRLMIALSDVGVDCRQFEYLQDNERFFVVGNVEAAGYLLRPLPFSIAGMCWPTTESFWATLLLFAFDIAMVALVSAVAASAMAIAQFAHEGNDSANWVVIRIKDLFDC